MPQCTASVQIHRWLESGSCLTEAVEGVKTCRSYRLLLKYLSPSIFIRGEIVSITVTPQILAHSGFGPFWSKDSDYYSTSDIGCFYGPGIRMKALGLRV